METKQLNKVSMFLAVQAVFDEPAFLPVWSGLARIKQADDDFDAIVAQILDKAGIQATPITGLAEGKNRAQVAMINAACDLAGDLHDVAVETQDDDLAAKADVRLGDLANLADAAVGPRCQELLKLAQAHATELADAGTTAADLTKAQGLIDAYVKLVAKPRVAITARKAVTGEILDLMTAADALLADRLDRLMRKFATKAPEFFHRYTNARAIVDLDVRHEKPATPPSTGGGGTTPA